MILTFPTYSLRRTGGQYLRFFSTHKPLRAPEGFGMSLPKPPAMSHLSTEQDHKDAAEWAQLFAVAEKKIPRELVVLSFSRSSGPGGQVRLSRI